MLNYTIKQLLLSTETIFRKYEVAQKSIIKIPYVAVALVVAKIPGSIDFHYFMMENLVSIYPSFSIPCRE